MKAVALVPLNDEPAFKDGDDGNGENGLLQVIIEVAVNGYVMTIAYEDGSDTKTIYDDFTKLLEDLKAAN